MTNTKKRAWIYTRIDAPEDTHGALKLQEKGLYDYAGHMGFAVAGISSDLGGGLDFDRPGLARLTAAAREGAFDILLVKSLSRLGRDTEITLELVRQLNETGVSVCSPLEGEIRLDAAPWNMSGMGME